MISIHPIQKTMSVKILLCLAILSPMCQAKRTAWAMAVPSYSSTSYMYETFLSLSNPSNFTQTVKVSVTGPFITNLNVILGGGVDPQCTPIGASVPNYSTCPVHMVSYASSPPYAKIETNTIQKGGIAISDFGPVTTFINIIPNNPVYNTNTHPVVTFQIEVAEDQGFLTGSVSFTTIRSIFGSWSYGGPAPTRAIQPINNGLPF